MAGSQVVQQVLVVFFGIMFVIEIVLCAISHIQQYCCIYLAHICVVILLVKLCSVNLK